jgi:tetratricopeptide (TPR) repeat protein
MAGVLAFALACHRDPAAASHGYVLAGDKYVSAGKFAEAALEYRNAADLLPLDGAVRLKLADALLRSGNTSEGAGEYVRAADLLPDDVGVQMKAGNLLLLGGRFSDARAVAEKLLKKHPKDVDAEILLANAFAASRNIDAALQQIEEALRVDPNRSGTYGNLGALELTRGHREEAEQAFRKAVDLDPRSVPAQLALGNFYWLTARPDLAETELRHAVDLGPTNPLSNRMLADFYLATNRPVAAEQPLENVYKATGTPASAFALADCYSRAGNDAAARALLEKLLGDPAAASAATVRLAALEYKTGDHSGAYRRIDEVLAHDGRNLQALLLKTNMLTADRSLDAALASAVAATQSHDDSAEAFYALGRVQALRREPDAAIAAFDKVVRLNPRATAAKVALANLHLAQGRPDVSLPFAQEALASDPSNADAQLTLVRDLLADGHFDRAATQLAELLRRFPDSPAAHAEQGMLLGRTGDAAGARREFERALQLQPGSFEPLVGLVALDLTAHDYAAARARVDDRLKGSPSAPLLALAARVYGASGDPASAEQFLRRAIQTDAGYLPAYGALGGLFSSQGRLDEARAEFEALAARSPKSVAAVTMVGLLMQAKGDAAGARREFERALQIDPEAAVAANNLAWMDAESGGDLDVALQLAQTAQKRLPAVAAVGDTLGYIYYKKNLASLAVSTLKRSVEQEPANATFQYHLGLAYASAGDTARARQTLAHALALNANFSGAREARAMLGSLGVR